MTASRYVYLAGPITGLEFDDANDWRVELPRETWWPEDWIALSPMRDKEKFKMQGPLPSRFDDGPAAVQRDLMDIAVSDAVILNVLNAQRTSLGTMTEMGFAYCLGRPIITVLEDGGVHDHLFVQELSSVVVETLYDAIDALDQVAHGSFFPARQRDAA